MKAEQQIPTAPISGTPADPFVSVPPGGTWTITTTNGTSATGYLPGWADDDPSQTGVSVDRLHILLQDIVHETNFSGQVMRLAPREQGPGEDTEVFVSSLVCTLETEGQEPPIPVVNIHLIEDFWIIGLGPNGIAEIAAALRAQADRLDHEVRPRLIAYRDDWTTHHLV
jgi:hypothetical protein